MRFAPLLLLALLVFPVISQVYAWDIERCYGHALWILQRQQNSHTDGNVSVGLGVDIQSFDTASGGSQQLVDMNVSVTANSRIGIRYDSDNIGLPLGYTWVVPNTDVNVTLEGQAGDEFIAPVDISNSPELGPFAFRFFGGTGTAQYTKAYVSSNGFISFDNTTQPSPSPQNASTFNPPNTLIAGVWTDLNIVAGQSSIIAGFWSPGLGQVYYVVIWNNVVEKTSGQHLTFEIILGNAPAPGINANPVYTQSQFWIIYHSVSNIGQQWACGFKDQTGNISRASIYDGGSLGSFNGEVVHYGTFYHNYILDRLTLIFFDPNGQYWIPSDNIRSWNLNCDMVHSAPDSLYTFGKSLIGSATLLISAAADPPVGIIAGGCFIVDTVLCTSDWADTYLAKNQYNLSSVVVFDKNNPTGTAQTANASGLTFDGAVDADLNLQTFWYLNSNKSVSNNATVVALLDYFDVSTNDGTKTPYQCITGLSLNVYPPPNISPATAQIISSGTNYSQNIIGNYTPSEFYNISVPLGDVISIWAQSYYLQNDAPVYFSIFLYDPTGNMRNSTSPPFRNGYLSYVANSSGNWTIEIRADTGSFGYYWVEALARLPILTISSSGQGTTTPTAGQYNCSFGQNVTVTASASSGWTFDHWVLDTIVKYGNPITVNMTADHSLMTYFMFTPGCPYVSSWNGSQYVLDNNLLAASMFSQGADVNDHYVLQQAPTQNPNGTYSLQISEFEKEHDFIDQVQLVAVDHASNVNVGVSPDGQILTYGTPNTPVSAITDTHENVKQLLSAIDGTYYEAHNGSYVNVNFGDLDISQGAKLVLRADYQKDPVFVQVQDSNGRWITVARVIPRVNWSTDIIDMSKFLPDARGNLKVRLCFTADLKVDFVGLDTSSQATLNIHKGQLVSAVSSIEGDVTAKLLHTDKTYAVLVPGENIQLEFTLPTQTLETRTYIIFARGHYYTVTQ